MIRKAPLLEKKGEIIRWLITMDLAKKE